jgi:hypothetical protein
MGVNFLHNVHSWKRINKKICLKLSSYYLPQKWHYKQMMLLAIHTLLDDKGKI